MNVFYNFELDSDIHIKMLENPIANTYLTELREFVKERLRVLQDEINKEEGSKACCSVLMIPAKAGDEEGIYYMGYSDKLISKMQSCLTGDDIIYLQNRIAFIFNSLN